jgi:hypothetical protein
MQITKEKLNTTIKMTAFWDIALHSLVDSDQYFRRAYCIHQGDVEVVSSAQMSVNIYGPTHWYIPEDSPLHTQHHENLKSHMTERLIIKQT